MPELITLITATMPSLELPRVVEGWKRVAEKAENLPGFRSMCIWRDCDLPLRYAVTFHEDVESPASLGIWPELMRSEEMFDELVSHEVAPDVRHIVVHNHHMAAPSDVPLGGWMSVSVRVAEIGYGEELAEELGEIFVQLRDLEGYQGSMIGRLYGLEEEVVGIVLWNNEAGFERSVPKKSMYEVRLFQRVS